MAQKTKIVAKKNTAKTTVKSKNTTKEIKKPVKKPVAKAQPKATPKKAVAAKTVKKTTKPAVKPVAKKTAPVKKPVAKTVTKTASKALTVTKKATPAVSKIAKIAKAPAKKPAPKPMQKATMQTVAAKLQNRQAAPVKSAPAKQTVQPANNNKPTTATKTTAAAPAAPTQKPLTSPMAVSAYSPQRPANLNQQAAIQVKKVPVNDPAQKPDFNAGEMVVYPAHGVGKVEAIETQRVGGQDVNVFRILFEQDKMVLKVPVYRVQGSGLRRLSSKDTIKNAIETMKGRPRIRRTMWSRRAQEYEAKINSGDPMAIAEVLRDLRRNADQGEQSYSERQIFYSALERLAREVAAVEKTSEQDAIVKLESVLLTKNRRSDLASDSTAIDDAGEAA